MEKVEELSKTLKGPGKLHPFKCDVTKEEDVLKAFQWVGENLGPISILVNNAGVGALVDLTSAPTEEFKAIFDTNVLGLCLATREASKVMLEKKIDGHIVHISSVAAHSVGLGSFGVYCASKHAVHALTEGLRKTFCEKGSKARITVS